MVTPRFRCLLRIGLMACALVFASASARAPADVRVALVIGNAAYPGPAALANPVNDARAVAAALRRLGFDVVELNDGSRAQMHEALEHAREALQGKQGVGLLFYAGHGLQMDWRNYMVPVDARITGAQDVPHQAVDVEAILARFKAAGTRMNILVLDACRDNPFGGTSTGKGLAPLDAPPGTFLAFATAPGNVADDGSGSNSLYTGFLVQELERGGAKIEDVFKRVRLQVRQKSAGRQVPWESTSLEEDFYFDGPQRPTADPAGERGRKEAFELQRAEWERIKDSREARHFYEFLQRYPSGDISELAAARLERLESAQVRVQPDRTGLSQDYALRRFHAGDVHEFETRDGLTGLRTGIWITRVLEVDDEGADLHTAAFGREIKSRSWHDGSVASEFYGEFDPPYMAAPAGSLQVGRKWTSRSAVRFRSGRETQVTVDGRVVAKERITVPAGSFDTYRVHLEMMFGTGMRRQVQLWVRPENGLAYKLINEERLPGSQAPSITIRELVRHRSQASPAGTR